MLYLGNGALPQASYVAFSVQQRVLRLKLEHLVNDNVMLTELMRLSSTIVYRKVDSAEDVCMFSLSDASHPNNRDYGQSGILTGILAKKGRKEMDVYHLTD